MDRFSALKVFTRVVEANSFTRAADSLNMPNATISKTIQQLESHLGVCLLQRTTRRITVTPEGREYYEKALRILKDLEEIDASFKSVRNKPKGHLRIAIGGSTARDVLIPLLADFMTSYPEIRIDLAVADKPADLISSNIDCAVRGGSMDDSTLIARKIGEAALITCATPDYLRRYGIPATPDELQNGHRLISYLSPASGRAFPFRFEHNGIATEIKTQHHLGINESNAHIAAGEAGLGIVQTFTYSVRNELASGALVEILSKWRPASYPFHLIYAQSRHVPPRLRVFIEWLAEAFPAAVKA
ncbi:LysR family transcriptional regulator [Mixta tenebrionis]|uniref:LysR family transcriptional regulator n=1 Tax=Mixta tenebrionis TaxID=2562439 RepID=A0A506V711_9GAMM|nr:LysR family transcriptional regulator [Mixta tenebrionis]TPW41448.1 LysR family transcriptional regulator [Mixta tenebrionis]